MQHHEKKEEKREEFNNSIHEQQLKHEKRKKNITDILMIIIIDCLESENKKRNGSSVIVILHTALSNILIWASNSRSHTFHFLILWSEAWGSDLLSADDSGLPWTWAPADLMIDLTWSMASSDMTWRFSSPTDIILIWDSHAATTLCIRNSASSNDSPHVTIPWFLRTRILLNAPKFLPISSLSSGSTKRPL